MQGVMEVGYKKDLRNNYMVLEKAMDKAYSSFCIKMLQRQEIKGLLSVEQKLIDNKLLLYYDITAKQAISNILDKSAMSVKALRSLCSGVISAIETAYEYLLPENDFILTPDFIYQDITSETPFLCLYPGYGINVKEQLAGLMEFLMNKVDYNDKEAVYLVYRLYAVSKEEGYTLEHFKEVLLEKEKGQQESGKKGKEHNSDSPYHTDIHLNNSIEFKRNKEERITLHNRAENLTESNIPVVMEKVEGEEEVTCYPMLTYLCAGGCLLAGIAAFVMGIAGKIIYNSLGTRVDYSKLAALIIVLGCVEGYLLSKIFDKKNKITKMVKTTEYIDPRTGYNAYPLSEITRKKHIIGLIVNKLKLTKGSHGKATNIPANSLIKNIHEGDYTNIGMYTCSDRALKGSKAIYEDVKSNTHADINAKSNTAVGTNTYPGAEVNVYPGAGINPYDSVYEATGLNVKVQRVNEEIEGLSPTCLLNAFPEKESMPVLKAMDKINYKDIPVTTYPFFIGKLKKNVDFCLNSDTVSRYHAKITKEGESFYLTDLNSTNGTYINDEPLLTYQKKELVYGDVITFANIKYQFIQE